MSIEDIPHVIGMIRTQLLDALGKASSFKLLKPNTDDEQSLRDLLEACKETGALLEEKIHTVLANLKSAREKSEQEIAKVREELKKVELSLDRLNDSIQ